MRLPLNTKNISGVWNMSLLELIDKGMWKQIRIGEDNVAGVGEKLTGPVHVADPLQKVVLSTWTVETKTQEEIDAESADIEVKILANTKNFAEGLVGRLFFNTLNEIRVLQGNPKYTKKQFLKIIADLKRIEWANEK